MVFLFEYFKGDKVNIMLRVWGKILKELFYEIKNVCMLYRCKKVKF